MTRPIRHADVPALDSGARESRERGQREHEWVERIRRSDASAFEALFHAFYSELAAFACRYVHSRDIAEEVVHDVLARIWERREQFELRDQLRTYLYTAVRNEALNRLRHSLVERRWRDRMLQQQRVEPAAARPDDADARLERNELAAALERVLAQVPERCRHALMLRWQQQMSYAEVAEAMGISVKAVEVYVRRGLIALRKCHATLAPHR